jgi:hypothetical protein
MSGGIILPNGQELPPEPDAEVTLAPADVIEVQSTLTALLTLLAQVFGPDFVREVLGLAEELDAKIRTTIPTEEIPS